MIKEIHVAKYKFPICDPGADPNVMYPTPKHHSANRIIVAAVSIMMANPFCVKYVMTKAKTKPIVPAEMANLVRLHNSCDPLVQSSALNNRTLAPMTTKLDAHNPYHRADFGGVLVTSMPADSCASEPSKYSTDAKESQEKKYKLASMTVSPPTAMSFPGFIMTGKPAPQKAIKRPI